LEVDEETHADVDDEVVVESGTRLWSERVGQALWSWFAAESPRRASGGKGISRLGRTCQSDMDMRASWLLKSRSEGIVRKGKAVEHGSSAAGKKQREIDNKGPEVSLERLINGLRSYRRSKKECGPETGKDKR
jgi:hypothetical protein